MKIENILVGKIYRHFKGNYYTVLAIAVHTETDEPLVVYQALYSNGTVYARPYKMFLEEINPLKYPNTTQKYRFELVDAESLRNY
jgi:hypothetical protein